MSNMENNGNIKTNEKEREGEQETFLRRRKRLLVWLIPIILVVLAGALIYWVYMHGRISTDDAFIEVHVSSVSPRTKGTVVKVLVKDNQWVKRGDVLVLLDQSSYRVKVEQAKAALEMAQSRVKRTESNILIKQKAVDVSLADLTADEADLKKISLDLKRYGNLLKKQEVSQQQHDTVYANYVTAKAKVYADKKRVESAKSDVELARAELNVAVASVKQAQANLDDAKLQLSYTVVSAPVFGRVTNKNVEVGYVVQRGQPFMVLVEKNPWVVANFKETQITHMRPGQKVEIEIDAYPDHKFYGHIDSIQSGSGVAFSLLPPENATGNFVKVTQRVPVKIVFDNLDVKKQSRYVLGPGMSVVPTVITE